MDAESWSKSRMKLNGFKKDDTTSESSLRGINSSLGIQNKLSEASVAKNEYLPKSSEKEIELDKESEKEDGISISMKNIPELGLEAPIYALISEVDENSSISDIENRDEISIQKEKIKEDIGHKQGGKVSLNKIYEYLMILNRNLHFINNLKKYLKRNIEFRIKYHHLKFNIKFTKVRMEII